MGISKILIYIILGIGGLFLATLIVGFLSSAFTNKKRFSGHAKTILNKLSNNEKAVVTKVWDAFKKGNASEANDATTNLNQSEVDHIKMIFDPQLKPKHLSSGTTNDQTLWFMYFNDSKEKGFGDTAAIIVAGVALNGIDQVVGNK